MTLQFNPELMKIAIALATSEVRYGTFGLAEGDCDASKLAARIFGGDEKPDEYVSAAIDGDRVADRAIRLAARAGHRPSAITDYLAETAIDGPPERAASRPKGYDRQHRGRAVFWIAEILVEQARLRGVSLTRHRQDSDHSKSAKDISACAGDYVAAAIQRALAVESKKRVAPMSLGEVSRLYQVGRKAT